MPRRFSLSGALSPDQDLTPNAPGQPPAVKAPATRSTTALPSWQTQSNADDMPFPDRNTNIGSRIGLGGTPTIPPTATPTPPEGLFDYRDLWSDFVSGKGYTAADARTKLPTWINEFNAANPGSKLKLAPDDGRQNDWDSVWTPDEGVVDVATSGNQWWWGPEGAAGSGGGGGMAGTSGTGPSGMSGPSSSLDAVFEQALAQMAQSGMTPYGGDISQILMSIIRNGSAPDLSRQLVGAREAEAAGMRGQVNDARAMLADRGVISEPGIPQGAESDAIERITQSLALPYSQAIGDIEAHGMDLAHDDVTNALQLATGMSSDQAARILQSVGTGSNRQVALAGIALQQLESDRDWQRFLSEFGLNHDMVMEQLRQGRVSLAIQLAGIFANQSEAASSGFFDS